MLTLCHPESLTELLTDQFGEEALESREVFPLDLASREAVFDPYNRRLKVYGALPADLDLAPVLLPEETDGEAVSKITVYSPASDHAAWEERGYRREGVIRSFFRHGRDAHLWAAYPDPDREEDPEERHDHTVRLAVSKATVEPVLPDGFACLPAAPDEAAEIATLMAETFPDYPTPITPEGVEQAMLAAANHYRVVRDDGGDLAAVASAELDHVNLSAEMTDCATATSHRGRGLMAFILRRLEEDVQKMFGISDLYTLARAEEVGMNCVFSKLGYGYSGRLINNCRMPTGWESMNVWCRKARAEA